MSKLFNCYVDVGDDTHIDKTWYQSSNIKYSECVDKQGDYKELTIVFSNGTQYVYHKVDAFDYLHFRDNDSQGRALNQFIKNKRYEYTKLDNADLDSIDEEYAFRSNNGFTFVNNENDGLIIYNNKEEKIYENKETKQNLSTMELICDILKSFGIILKEKTNE